MPNEKVVEVAEEAQRLVGVQIQPAEVNLAERGRQVEERYLHGGGNRKTTNTDSRRALVSRYPGRIAVEGNLHGPQGAKFR